MSEPFIGQIEIFGFGFAPRGWAMCNGQLLAINQNQALFSLLGTQFGGNGIQTFALPDLRGRTSIGQGNGRGLSPRTIGQVVGEDTHTLSVNEMPQHSHNLGVITNSGTTNTQVPGPTVALAQTTGVDQDGNTIPVDIYSTSQPIQPMAPASIGNVGGQPHSNIMPSLVLNFCIALTGIFPSRN